ncbi:hypothetical protein Syun_028500 [Stephania yunnanensis]|uniref:At4g15545-like C-terminal domain-containing protein n=1 Tax=Stephania yunnanensis TaxID=152371 RepID=A0AAP0EHV9_9MAGN
MSSYSSGTATDFHLPDEILSVIPTDPYDQLDLARKITSMAIASRVSKLESENGRLRQKVSEKDRLVQEMEQKMVHTVAALQEAESRLRAVHDENIKLSKERDSLAATAKRLSRDFAKLEAFKRQLMQSLNDDNSSVRIIAAWTEFEIAAETVEIRTCDQSVPKSKDDVLNTSAEAGISAEDGLKPASKIFSLTPYITPRFTPTGTPSIISTSGSPRGYSAAGSPKMTSGATSPTFSKYDGSTSFSSWYSSSQQSSAASSPPRGRTMPVRTPRIDGKEFFRQARSRLSYEQFSAFLANIKELNAQRQSREDMLKKAEEIFGLENKDLYLSFQGLLNRNAH